MLCILMDKIIEHEYMDELFRDMPSGTYSYTPSKATKISYWELIDYLSGETGDHHGEEKEGESGSGFICGQIQT